MAEFCGAWKFVSCENFDNYLKELGINVVLRKLAAMANPTVIFSTSENEGTPGQLWTMRTETLVKSCNAHFHLDEAFTETTIDDRVVQSIFTIENNQENKRALVQVSTDKQGRKSRVERVVREDVMKVTMTVNNVISTAFFKRVKK